MNNQKAYDTNGERLREHPVARGIGQNQTIDISEALKQLRAETHPAIKGHRQVTLFHQSPVSLVLFTFDDGGELPEHVTDGMVTIQTIEGSLTVHYADTEQTLESGQILVLNRSIPHSVRANTSSAMLLTVHQQ